MSRNFKVLASALAMSLAAAGGVKAASVYIPEGSAGEVAIVDAESDAIVGRIGDLPHVHGLAGAAGARYLVAGSYDETAPDAAPTAAKPSGVSDEEHAAHHGQGSRSAAGAVSILTILDARDGSPVRRLEVPGAVHHVAVSPDGRFAVATHPRADGISVIDLSNFSVGDLVRTGRMPNYAVFSADGARLYVSNAGNGTVSEIDTQRWFVTRNLLAGETPEHLALSPDGRALYVANVETGSVSELAIETGEISRSFAIGGELHGLDISEDGGTLFVGGKGEQAHCHRPQVGRDAERPARASALSPRRDCRHGQALRVEPRRAEGLGGRPDDSGAARYDRHSRRRPSDGRPPL